MTDEEQIRELLALWGQKYADRDAVGWSELFVEGGKFVAADGNQYLGRASIRQALEDRVAKLGGEWHTTYVCGPAVIRVRDDAAESASDYAAYSRTDRTSAWQIVSVGRLHNLLVRAGQNWLFKEVRDWAYFSGDHVPARLPSVNRR